ncbi:hypothetical protein Btru_064717 [Bulinus truncatus]|nr:hypothetical protein Btru_064717 [Bulinus truncatus]
MKLTYVTASLVILLSIVEVSHAQVPSKSLMNFVSMMSGYFVNNKQVARDVANEQATEHHDLITVLWQPVYIPSLAPAITFYHEEVANGKLIRRLIWVFSEVGNEIHIQPLNVSGFGSGQGDFENFDWSTVNIKPEEEICAIVFQHVEEEVYMGTIPDCTKNMPGVENLPNYSFTVTCTAVSVLVHTEDAIESLSKVPYVFRIQTRIPLPEFVTDKVND